MRKQRNFLRLVQMLFAFSLGATATSEALAWGRIGHDLAGRTAAALLAKTKEQPFFRAHAFDLGYYCNVPDLIWKKPATYDKEKHQHFMDLEIFDRVFKQKVEQGKLLNKDEPFSLERKDFEVKFPEIKPEAGRAFWRIRELEKRLSGLGDLLKQKELVVAERHRIQGDWLVIAGTICHYVSDLSQPLHVSENYDGEMTQQKGVHKFFEETVVDEMWPSLNVAVQKEAEKIYESEKASLATKSVLTLLKELAAESSKDLDAVLKLDKKLNREDVAKATEAFRPIVTRRLARGSVYLTEILRRHAQWKPNDEKFYNFVAEPQYINP